ncbi:hypothetical protein BY458DRAFT_514984 [Sporodiniella umbellata]|nr:hypothetical protein BY458DRAFT_514984 [Sporodiniella umbellata]
MSDTEYGTTPWSLEENEYKAQARNTASSSRVDPFQSLMTTADFQPEPMTVRVYNPQKTGSFVVFELFVMTSLEKYTSRRPVKRRYSDFVWLHDALSMEFPTCVIPPLPEKYRIKFIKGDRFDAMFIEQRRLGLQWFMDRIARHPYLQASDSTCLFLESSDFISDKTTVTKPTTAFSHFFKTVGKVKKPEERFEQMKEIVDKFQDNLEVIERLYLRIGKREQLLEGNYQQFALSIRGLSGLETHIDQPLRQFAECVENYASTSKEQREKQELYFLNDMHELLNYCHAIKSQLNTRDYKQIAFEDMSSDLQSIVFERERILQPGKFFGHSSGMNITEFMTDKMTDSDRTRSEKVMRLEFKIKQLEECVAKANDDNNHYSAQMTKEFDLFQQARQMELKHSLAVYADSHIDFYKKSISTWERLLPLLDQIQ